MQWDTVVILCRVWMDVYHSSALQDPFTAEAVRLHCGEGECWETEANSSCHLPVGCLPQIQQDSKDVVGSAPAITTAALQFCGRALYWQRPLLPWAPSARPCCLLCIQSSGFLFGCKTLQMCQRDIPQREENPKNG